MRLRGKLVLNGPLILEPKPEAFHGNSNTLKQALETTEAS